MMELDPNSNAIHNRLIEQDKVLAKQNEMLSRIDGSANRVDENLRLLREELIGSMGNPGRLTKLELLVDDHEKHKNRAWGFTAAIAAFFTFLEGITHWREFISLFGKK